MAKTLEPVYTVVKDDGDCQLRDYAAVTLAEMPARGERRAAINVAFNALFRYIGGYNQHKRKLGMTAPVVQSPDGVNAWSVGFFMPSGESAATLPPPGDTQVTLRDQPGQLCAAYRFSGVANERRLNNAQEALEDWVQAQGYRLTGKVFYAFYDPPWTLPFLRRNEIIAAVEKA